jgi:hypothetical protein
MPDLPSSLADSTVDNVEIGDNSDTFTEKPHPLRITLR